MTPFLRKYRCECHDAKEAINRDKGEGSLLDHSMVVFGLQIRDGNSHNPRNVPVVVAGKASGGLRPGRHLVHDEGTPLCSLWLGLLDKAGVKTSKLGDASSALKNLG